VSAEIYIERPELRTIFHPVTWCVYIRVSLSIYMSLSVRIHGGHPRKQRLPTGTKDPRDGRPMPLPSPRPPRAPMHLPLALANW
jgi:hypothetical protein